MKVQNVLLNIIINKDIKYLYHLIGMTNYHVKYFSHGHALWWAWFVALFINMASVRWFSQKWNKTIFIHAFTGWVITIMTLYYVLKLGLDFSLNKPHNFVGSLYVIVIVPVAITGTISMIFRKNLTWNTKLTNFFRVTHKYIASTLVLASFMQLFSGLLIYHKYYR